MTVHSITSVALDTSHAAPLLITGPAIARDHPAYLVDESRMQGGPVTHLYFPVTPAETAAVVNQARAAGAGLTVSGARTGITGAAVPQGPYLMSVEKMNRVLGVRPGPDDSWLVTVEPGITLDAVAALVAEKRFDPALPGAAAFNREPRPFWYPVDPTERSASIGGTCATNASGARTFHYGPTRDYIAGLKVVLDNGELLTLERGACRFDPAGRVTLAASDGSRRTIPLPAYRIPAVKHAAGYYAADGMDLIDLFIGSEGTLGVIVEVTLRVIPAEPAIFSAVAFFPAGEDAIEFTLRARTSAAVQPLALEFFDGGTLELLRAKHREEGAGSRLREIPAAFRAAIYFEQSYAGDEQLMARMEAWEALLAGCHTSMDNTWSGMEPAEQRLLKEFRHAVPEGVNTLIARRKQADARIHKVGTDMSVPDAALRDMYALYRTRCAAAGLEYVIFGHIGDNHLHVNILPRNFAEVEQAQALYLEFARRAVAYGGSVAAEHGIGKLKRKFLPVMFGEEGMTQMRAVKAALDPAGIFCPGNLF
ncbi:MAG: FAD-binding oxidoreductase [Planctomycetota bacterium]